VTRGSEAIAGAPDAAGGAALAGLLASHGIPAEVRDAGSGFVDVVVPHAFRDEARKLLKAHFAELARQQEPVVVAIAPDGGAGFGMAGALQAAGIPATARGDTYGPTFRVLVPHGMADAAQEFLATLEAELDGAETDGDAGHDDAETPGTDAEVQAGTRPADALAGDGGDESAPSASECVPEADAVGGSEAAAVDAVPADEVEPAWDGPPAYGSDLRPDFGDASGPAGGGL
jgi:hypothetical protein